MYVVGFDARKAASERRRLKRQDLRHADTICYACRQQGHAARDCTATLSVAESTAKGRNPKIKTGPSNGVGI